MSAAPRFELEVATYSPQPCQWMRAYTASDLEALPNQEWQIRDLFGKGHVGMLVGLSGDGKSFVVLNLIAAALSGRAWASQADGYGHAVQRPLTCVYVTGEGRDGLKKRWQALKSEEGLGRDSDENRILFYLDMPDLLQLNKSDADVKASLDDIRQRIEGPTQENGWASIDFVVLDTVSNAAPGLEENEPEHAKRFLRHVRLCLTEPLGCAVLVVHHKGKGPHANGARGTTAWRDNVDFMLDIESSGEGRKEKTLSCTKLKDGECWDQKKFGLQRVDLGIGPKGEPISSAVVRFERSTRSDGQANSSEWDARILDIFDTKGAGQALTISDVISELSVMYDTPDRSTISRRLEKLKVSGRLQVSKPGNGKTTSYWI